MPTRISKFFNSTKTVAKASRGTLSSYAVGVPEWMGQPLPMQTDAQGLITPERMREIVMKTPTASAAMNATLDYAGGVNIKVRNIDPAKPVPKGQMKAVKKLLNTPNPQQTTRQFMLAIMRDMFTMGYAAVEIEPDNAGEPLNLWVLDAARLRVDYDEHGTVLGYDMFDAHGMPIREPGSEHGWEPDEVIFMSLNPASNSVYPYSRISQLFTCAVVEDLMLFFISLRFTDSNVPFGVFDLGDVSEPELKTAINNWNSQAKEQHKILLTGSKGGAKFTPFGYHLKDLEVTGLLSEVRGKVMAIVGVTMNELGESQDVSKSNGYNLSYTFKKRAIEPMLNEITQAFTRQLLGVRMRLTDIELYYEEIDSRDELLQAQIDDVYLKMGVLSVNDIRNRRGDKNIPGGEQYNVFTGSAWIPVNLIEQMAKSMLMAESAGGATMSGPEGADNARVKVGGTGQQTGGTKKPDGAAHAQRSLSGKQ